MVDDSYAKFIVSSLADVEDGPIQIRKKRKIIIEYVICHILFLQTLEDLDLFDGLCLRRNFLKLSHKIIMPFTLFKIFF